MRHGAVSMHRRSASRSLGPNLAMKLRAARSQSRVSEASSPGWSAPRQP
jgi:hypothetical protein